MAKSITVNIKGKLPDPDDIRARLQGAEWRAFLKERADDLAQTMRKNVIKHGKRGGDWPELSGYMANKNRSRDINRLREKAAESGVGGTTARHKLRQEMAEQRRSERSRRRRQRLQRESKDLKSHGPMTREQAADNARAELDAAAAQHLGYARQKAAGKTPGHGKFGPGDRLMDTGTLMESFRGDIPNATTIRASAEGQLGDRPSNLELLVIHATGDGVPVRDPTADMDVFEERCRRRFADIIKRPFKAKTIDVRPS